MHLSGCIDAMNDKAVMKHSVCPVHLKEIQQPGLHFCLLYGSDYICLSQSLHGYELFGFDFKTRELRCLGQFYSALLFDVFHVCNDIQLLVQMRKMSMMNR